MLTPGALLQNRYHILRQIGGGGMAVVYLAEDTRLSGRLCAIKELSPAQLPPQDRGWAIAAFRQEADILANLRHPGLTLVTDFFGVGGDWYLVMEYVEGETLETRLERSAGDHLPWRDVLDIIHQLCDALGYLHGRTPPVVFRDLKPGNVMLTPQGQAKLIDFGIARFFKPGQTRDTVNLGTPGYAAPEQYGGQGQTDPRSDTYSLGILLHQLLTGHDPTLMPMNLPPIRTLNPGVSPEIEAVIQRATHIQPAWRFQSVQELVASLPSPAPVSPSGFNWRTSALAAVGVVTLLLIGLNIFEPPRPTPTARPPTRVSATHSPTETPLPSDTPVPPSAPAHLSFIFDSDRDGDIDIYRMAEDGSNVVKLTDNTWDDGDPAWSPDGKRIAFDSNRDNDNWDIYLMNTDGSGVVRLTDHPANEETPAWSPDSTRVLFKSFRDGNGEVYAMNVSELSLTNLTNHPAHDRAAAWSPNGRQIAFVSNRSGNNEIWVMNADGSGVLNRTNHPGEDWFPAWSPDGRRIAFHSYRDGDADIYVMNVDGSGLSQLTNAPGDDWGPFWSPDGLRLAFTSDRDGDRDIYLMHTDGSQVVQITHNTAHDTWPVWSPMSYVRSRP